METFQIQELRKEDYFHGFLELLEQLTIVDAKSISFDDFSRRFNDINSVVYVIHDPNDPKKIIGTASLVFEKKFIRKLSTVAHIEDVVVDKAFRGKGLGILLIKKLVEVSKNHGCYKVILDCSEKNEAFYEKIGFKKKEIQMALYFK